MVRAEAAGLITRPGHSRAGTACDMASMSFSFSVKGTQGESWRETQTGQIERTLRNVHLREISTVALPAYPATRVAARGMQSQPVSTISQPFNNPMQARNRMMRRLMMERLPAA